MPYDFKFTVQHELSCAAHLLLFANVNNFVTVHNIEYNHVSDVATVQCTHPVTMRDADNFVKQCVEWFNTDAPIVRFVLNDKGEPTGHQWFSDAANSFYVTNYRTGETQWETTICAVVEHLAQHGVTAPYEQFE